MMRSHIKDTASSPECKIKILKYLKDKKAYQKSLFNHLPLHSETLTNQKSYLGIIRKVKSFGRKEKIRKGSHEERFWNKRDGMEGKDHDEGDKKGR